MTQRATTVVWDETTCERAHAASLEVLERAGVLVHHAGALEMLAAAGARVEGQRAFIPREVVQGALASAPASFAIPGRGRAGMVLAQGETWFGTGPDCLYLHEPGSGERRRARLDDVRVAADLCEKLDDVDFVMSMALPEEAPITCDDVLQFKAMLEGTTKPLIVSTSHGGDGLAAMRDMAAACGEAASFGCLVMTSPPLKIDHEAADKLIACARLGIPAVLAPAPSAGATAPASIVSAVVVGVAEVLAGLCINQLARPGAPFIFGAGAAALDMRVAVDAYVIPEHFLGNQATCDLVRWYGLPSWAYAGPSDSKALDGQWAADVAITTMLGGLSRATLLHDLGYMESGMAGSLSAIVFGAEMASFARAFLQDLPIDEASLQLDEILAVGPGGSHLGRPFTRAHYKDFWQSRALDHGVHERWQANGATSLRERLDERTAVLLAAAPLVQLPDATRCELEALVAAVEGRRTAQV
jgi:trimethylamine---corrinoid protein Co-methyltransferase